MHVCIFNQVIKIPKIFPVKLLHFDVFSVLLRLYKYQFKTRF